MCLLVEDKYSLTTNQRAFADEYIANKGNATQAYLKAYPNVTKETTANSNGSRLLRNAKVAGYIAERTKETLEAQKMTGDEILITLVSTARREQQTSYSKQYDHLEEKVIKEITYTFQPTVEESTRALEMLVKWAGLDSPNNDLQRERMKAETQKAQAQAEIMKSEADKLLATGKGFELLQSLVDVVNEDED